MKIAQGIAPAGRLYSRFWSNVSKNFSFWGRTPLSLHRWGRNMAWRGPLLHAKFHPKRCNMSPLWGEKPQNRPVSKLNTGRLALRAILPVIKYQLRNMFTQTCKLNYSFSRCNLLPEFFLLMLFDTFI